MIIIGEMNLTLKRAAGQFYCPHCTQPQSYVHKRVKRFLTIYFIPLIPLDTVSEHVECQKCRKTFALASLQLQEADYERMKVAQFADDVRRVMVLTMLADDRADEAEIGILRQVYRRLAHSDLSETDIQRDLQQARKARVDAATYCRAGAPRRPEEEKDGIVRGAFLISTANGELSPERLAQLKLIPTALGVPEERFRRIVENLEA